ncbi:hypothetical protein CGRA01v4_03504 [Colletotrichum graminicola]|nr:hypothetical protein CGRA01v4_03504 [Colletotrichum graminicola]
MALVANVLVDAKVGERPKFDLSLAISRDAVSVPSAETEDNEHLPSGQLC